MNESLDELLAGLRARGVLDSSDSFGVDMIRGEAKLARFQLVAPGLYLVKVLQGVAQTRPSQVHVRLGAGEVCLTSLAPEHQPDPEALRDTRHLSQDLVIGLRAAAASYPLELYWEEWNGQRGARLTLGANGQLSVTPTTRPPAGCDARCGRFFLKRERSFYDRLQGGPSMLEEHHAVTKHCGYYPVPLWLDGRQLNATEPGFPGVEARVGDERVHPDYWLMRRCLVARAPALPWRELPGEVREVGERAPEHLGGSEDQFRRPGAYYQQLLGITHEQPWFPLDKATRAPSWCHADLRLPVSLLGRSQVLYVKHGAVLESLEADLGCPGARATVSMAAPTDLSQFALVRADLNNFHLYLQAHVRSMLTDLRWQLKGLLSTHPGLHELLVRRIGTPQTPRRVS